MADAAYQIAFRSVAVEDGFYGAVVSLTVEENTATASTARLRLRIERRDDGSWTYLEDERFAPFAAVSVRIGFAGGAGLAGALGGVTGGNDGMEPVFDGYVTGAYVDLGSKPGDTFLDVHAMDTSVLMSLEEKVATWPNLADSDIVRQVIGGYGLRVQADPTPTVHQQNDTTVIQRGSDIQFVRALARRNGFEFYLETDKQRGDVVAYFRPPQLSSAPQADLAIQFGGDSNLRHFSARLNAQRPLTVKTAQVDVKANGANTGRANRAQGVALGATDLDTLVGGPLGSLVTPKEAQAQMLVLGPPTSDATELQTVAQAVRDEADWFITADGEINSNAYQAVLRPHRLALVKGASKPYSGKYYVTRIVHQLKADGSYTQTFEARRNARDVDGSEQFGGSNLGLSLSELQGGSA